MTTTSEEELKSVHWGARFGAALRFLVGLDRDLRDARPAWVSSGIVRIGIFLAIYETFRQSYIAIGDQSFAEWFAIRAPGVYHPFGILRFFGDTIPSIDFWNALRWIAEVSTICAIIGFITRPMMIVSVFSCLLWVLLRISESYFWSHSWNVVFLAAIPFAFSAAGSGLSVDRVIAKRFPLYPFGHRNEPVLWGVLTAQASVALFVFIAFYAKIFNAFYLGGIDGPFWYVFSDNMRNVLGVFWLGTPENIVPPWIEWAWSIPIVWMILMLGHLVMQAAPAAAFFSLHKPVSRTIEGFIFFAGIIALGIVANGWNWAWIPLTLCFVDWDYFLKQPSAERPAMPRFKAGAMAIGLGAFFGAYILGGITQTANSWGFYPFSNMNFYATFYVRPPYSQHLPYADYMIGEVTVQPTAGFAPEHTETGWCNATNKTWKELKDLSWYRCFRIEPDGQMTFPYFGNDVHGLGREPDLDRLKQGLKLAARSLNLGALPDGSRYVAWLKTAGFPPYPERMKKKTLHAGVRGIWDPITDQFTGMTTKMDRTTHRIIIDQIDGEIGDPRKRLVFARINAHMKRDVQPLLQVPGRWLDDRVFQIDPQFIEANREHRADLWNSFIRTETVFGPVDFDGPVEWL